MTEAGDCRCGAWFSHLAEARKSVRSFDCSRPVSSESITAILKAGAWAPSAKNRQPWRFAVVQRVAHRRCIAGYMEVAARVMVSRDVPSEVLGVQIGSLKESAEVVRTAPCTVFVFCVTDKGWTGGNEAGWGLALDDLQAVDMMGIGACMQNMALMATSLGIGSLWMCDVLYAAKEISQFLGFDVPLVAAMSFGFEKNDRCSRKAGRRELPESAIWFD